MRDRSGRKFRWQGVDFGEEEPPRTKWDEHKKPPAGVCPEKYLRESRALWGDEADEQEQDD